MLDKKLTQCIVFVNYDVIHYVIFLKRGSQALVFMYLPVSLFSPFPGSSSLALNFKGFSSRTLLLEDLFSEARIDALSHWTEPLQVSACFARAESFFIFSKNVFLMLFDTCLNGCLCFTYVSFTV